MKQAQTANAQFQAYIAALEAELAIWRSGGSVDQSEWASQEKAGTPAAPKKAPTPSTPSSVRSVTPINPVIESLRGEIDSRPQTPTVVGLDKDEREEFLRRENELSDQLAEKESALVTSEKMLKDTREELSFLKERERSLSTVRSLIFSVLPDCLRPVSRKTNLCPLS